MSDPAMSPFMGGVTSTDTFIVGLLEMSFASTVEPLFPIEERKNKENEGGKEERKIE